MRQAFVIAAATALLSTAAPAAEISTHLLDLARGVGGAGVAVTLLRRGQGGEWNEVGKALTDANGRVSAFGAGTDWPTATYKLHFDLAGYPDKDTKPFFPEIDLVFTVSDSRGHYHVPVVLSPFGYSTYRGN